MEKVWEGVQRTAWPEDVVEVEDDFSLRLRKELARLLKCREDADRRTYAHGWRV